MLCWYERINEDVKVADELVRGPKVGAVAAALQGFLKKNSIASEEELVVKKVKNDEYYFFNKKGEVKKTVDILQKILPLLIADIGKSFSKVMRWGRGDLKWVRPLRNILCIFEGGVVDFSYGGLQSNNLVQGHRFLSKVKEKNIFSIEKYLEYLVTEKVVLDQEKREKQIRENLDCLAKKHSVEIIKNDKLLQEVTGLVEYPVILCGKIDKKFMYLPKEVLVTSLRNHQKYFCAVGEDGDIAPYFFFVSNNDAKNNQVIIEGNQKVLAARLEDALFFYEDDKKIMLETRLEGIR